MARTRLPTVVGEKPVVRVVLPAGPLIGHEANFTAGLCELEKYGFEIRWDPKRAEEHWRGYLGGTDATRLTEFKAALVEPDVDVVWCGRGGSGCNRIADDILKFAKTLPTPKCLIGFSDITAILNPLSQQLGWITFHGPVITSLATDYIETDISEILRVFRGQQTELILPEPFDEPKVSGRLLGGNLTVLASMLGTPTAPRAEHKSIWLLEDVGEPAYRLDRAFNQLKRAGLFENASAIWLGDLGLSDRNTEIQMYEQLRSDAPCPVLLNAPAGHRASLRALPLGATVDIQGGRLTNQHPWVTQ
ncbi:MAG: hypothetical protein CMH52_02685 [Myxococcales bacterium]|nr:hypothetical protein [Myxococcales bacterium]